jgi:hypothetical protein
MANLSSAYGTFNLHGAWSYEMINNLNILKKEWADWYYWTNIEDEFNLNQRSNTFTGCGRWAYNSNLEILGESIERSDNSDTKNAYINLCALMESSGAYIEVNYTDEECGFNVLYTATAKFSATTDGFIYEETAYEGYDYTPDNLVQLGFYEDINSFLENNCWDDSESCGYTELCGQQEKSCKQRKPTDEKPKNGDEYV